MWPAHSERPVGKWVRYRLAAGISFIQLDISSGNIDCHQRTSDDSNAHLLLESRDGIFLATGKCMNDKCRHCDETITGNGYRVISEEDGVVLLNMVVCASCAAVAKSLLLHTEEITSDEHRAPSALVSDVSDQLFHGRFLSTSH